MSRRRKQLNKKIQLLVTADDYGMTYGVTDGILTCIREGILTQTGLFVNMKSSSYAAKRIQNEFPDFCLGQDINIVIGTPLSNPKDIPSLIENGNFISSAKHRNMHKVDEHHIRYEDILLETENQVIKFIEMTGRIPCYITGHAYSNMETKRALKEVAQKYHTVVLHDILTERNIPSGNATRPWIHSTTDFSLENQMRIDPASYFLNGQMKSLIRITEFGGIGHIHTHAGFMDEDLSRLSSFTAIRMKEADFLCSEVLKEWVNKYHIELISINDLL